jgi:hypothetical protein
MGQKSLREMVWFARRDLRNLKDANKLCGGVKLNSFGPYKHTRCLPLDDDQFLRASINEFVGNHTQEILDLAVKKTEDFFRENGIELPEGKS